MSFINKLNDTCELISKLDDFMNKDVDNNLIKKQLLNVSNDLASYKDINKKFIQPHNNEIKHKILEVLDRIDQIEINVKNKLKITEKYSSYLNS